ncbi:M1 family metallopeptidase [Flavobacterium sp. NG2]|uniref:M1 family metallopeptidase n=1 Tax=Flavobacterium sp. NG2 TaxID=3097547 RepID=UPI002A837972|nr:M1 family metallopeptidase [Flavobacterium sp. NG2]WPR70777.1 M1 family metallopeptidase [Flavobacterium sp. NG2]
MKTFFVFHVLILLLANGSFAQSTLASSQNQISRQDKLRGSVTKERGWWDVKKYCLDVKINPSDSSISGSNKIIYKVVDEYSIMQIDLQQPLQITEITQEGKRLKFSREGNAFFVNLVSKQEKGSVKELIIFFKGKPKTAVNPPWDGGIVWKKDKNGKPFIASTCQGIGASIWWPNKDHLADEVESMDISVNVPFGLVGVANGRLVGTKPLNDGTITYNWQLLNPINNYGVNFTVGDYVSFSETYQGKKGNLDCKYYVLKSNLEKAAKQFKEVPRVLKAFEHWFGPYPFYEDSYKLVEVPYLGMEHQSAISYGNGYKNGYLGTDLSKTGWGLQFDFIIVHESGHEWFGNSITNKDNADMWIHESFTSYAESLFVEYYFGIKAGFDYVKGTRINILNDKPIIGLYDVNDKGSSDMYFKGANMLHSLRQIVDNDDKWRMILTGLNSTFYHQTVTSKQIEDYFCKATGLPLIPFFNQYLRDKRVPTFEYKINKNKIEYRWVNCVSDFYMPIKVFVNGQSYWIEPNSKWKTKVFSDENIQFTIDNNFYILDSKIAN